MTGAAQSGPKPARYRVLLSLEPPGPSGDTPVSKNVIVSTVVALIVVALAFALNPSPEQHRAEISKAMGERSPLAALLGLGSLTAFVSTYHPLGVASYTTVNDRVVSVGAFGVVVFIEPSKKK
jgi:hypothetical protein